MDTTTAATTITLSVGGVDFTLCPSSDKKEKSLLQFQQVASSASDCYEMKLENFTGTLRVVSSATTTVPSSNKRKQTSPAQEEASKRIREELAKCDDDDSVATDVVGDIMMDDDEAQDDDNKKQQDDSNKSKIGDKKANSNVTFRRNDSLTSTLQPDDEEEEDVTTRTTTLLCQPDCSQTQVDDSDDFAVNGGGGGASQEQEELANKVATTTSTTQTNKAPPARVSLAASSPGTTTTTPSSIAPPPARWGHTLTKIGDNRVLVYGGQTIDDDGYRPQTLSDVWVYLIDKKTWVQPFNCQGKPRQWHTATYLPHRKLLISFGGEAINNKNNKTVSESNVMVLDTEIMLWYPPSVTGTIPTARSGHTATVLNKTLLVVFGGVRGRKWLNTVSVLDTQTWKWKAVVPKTGAPPPPPRSYHTATAVGDHKIVVFGGNDSNASMNSVHVLELVENENGEEEHTWKWSHPTVRGTKPKPRTGHSAVLLDDSQTIAIYGGWDPNADDDEEDDDDEEVIFDDCYLLDTETWIFAKSKRTFDKRVGHAAVAGPGGKDGNALVFGGRVSGDAFTNDFLTMDLP